MADYSVRRIHNLSIAIGVTGSCLAAVASIPAIRAVVARYQLKKENDLYQSLCQLYQDEDGHATELSSEAFSDRFQRSLIALASLTGVLASLAIAVLDTDGHGVYGRTIILQWLIFTVWVSEEPVFTIYCNYIHIYLEYRISILTYNLI